MMIQKENARVYIFHIEEAPWSHDPNQYYLQVLTKVKLITVFIRATLGMS